MECYRKQLSVMKKKAFHFESKQMMAYIRKFNGS